MTRHFDVLVVGAGSAGSAIASRLSEDATCRVGLIEAGHMPADPDIADPLKWTQIQGRDYDWAYRTTPQPFTANRVHEWPRGKVVGGSSCLHAMAYVRGHPDDFVPWEKAGGARWSYEGLLPYFKRSEAFAAFPAASRGNTGPLDVILPEEAVSPIARAYMAAGNALGAPKISDHNTSPLNGTTPNSLNIRDGRRLSVADAYLTPEVLARRNLTLLNGYEIERIEFNGTRAAGVLAVVDRIAERVSADRVVLCAGAISSPLILMRSGIGDPEALRSAGIHCHIESREVGANLQDHLLALGNVYRSKKPVPPSRLQHSESLMYLHSKDVTRAYGSPDIVLGCVVAPSAAEGLEAPAYGSAYTILCGVTHPTSRGRILPGGPTRSDTPIIDPHYLETEYDRLTFRTALKIAREVGHHSALAEWRDVEIQPGPAAHTDAALDDFIARAASTHHHPCGTCRMGGDDNAVVDPSLRVKGLENVFVVDASIIPQIPSGPINAAVVAIAESWAASAPSLA
ncbi:GMC family oxidoreductase [Pseudaminobacter soli (ex Li et al. 2025)]|uniref:Pyridoxine 4-oxidase n=1 Tax=Pseudaminobacter soli (ex Li et al. 2025) TaxID=1295366 RepID=A0A2P7S907_9HYPH|nr:GMC family oxidoreductase N-terminal domain-containing protein [Mesorhizobium soli]PSJ58954.1 pyridoxine 4-oxidase [Mesorhizobium soli]